MLLFLLRNCYRRWRHQSYDNDQKSLCERMFGSNGTKGQWNIYAINDPHTPTAPLSLYNMSMNNDFYSSGRPYIKAEATEIDNVRFLANEFYPNPIVSDRTTSDLTELVEPNIKKNYIIDEIQNYCIQQSPSYNEYHIKHNQEIQTLPGPTITIINMAAERITDDPNWEEANPFEIQYDRHDDLLSNPKNNQSLRIKQTATRYNTNDPSSLKNPFKYGKQPNMYTRQSDIRDNDKYSSNLNKKMINHILEANFHQISDNDDNDVASIYKISCLSTPKKQSPVLLENEDEYKTAGIDEVEIEIKDLIRLQKTNNTYDILSTTNRTRTVALSSSSTLQNLISSRSQGETNRIKLRQTGQQLEDHAFFISLPLSSIRYEKQPAIYYHQDRQIINNR